MTPPVSSSRQEFWLSHRRRAKAEGLSLSAYALRESLSLSSLYAVSVQPSHLYSGSALLLNRQ